MSCIMYSSPHILLYYSRLCISPLSAAESIPLSVDNMTCWLNMFTWIKWHCVYSQGSWNILFSCFNICLIMQDTNLGHVLVPLRPPVHQNSDSEANYVFCGVLILREWSSWVWTVFLTLPITCSNQDWNFRDLWNQCLLIRVCSSVSSVTAEWTTLRGYK